MILLTRLLTYKFKTELGLGQKYEGKLELGFSQGFFRLREIESSLES
jgi:hypothetical protein